MDFLVGYQPLSSLTSGFSLYTTQLHGKMVTTFLNWLSWSFRSFGLICSHSVRTVGGVSMFCLRNFLHKVSNMRWQSYTRLNRMDGHNVFQTLANLHIYNKTTIASFQPEKWTHASEHLDDRCTSMLWTYPWSSLWCQEYYQLVFEDSRLGRSQWTPYQAGWPACTKDLKTWDS